MDSFLIPLFSALFSIIFYPILMLYVAIIAGAGVFTWLILTAMVSPYIALWYCIAEKREKLHVEGLMWPSSNADIDQKIDEYVNEHKKQ